MKLYAATCSIAVIGLFALDHWAAWFMATDKGARAFVLSVEFTAILAIGGVFVSILAALIAGGLLLVTDEPSGRSEPEDHA